MSHAFGGGRHVFWSREETEALADGFREGATASELTTEFRRSLGSIEYKRRKLRLGLVTGRRPDPYKRAKVLSMLADGKSMRRIARELGLVDSSVQRMCRRMVEDGLLKRTGDLTRRVRYVLTNDVELREVSSVNLARSAA